jgi:hypothetical protein
MRIVILYRPRSEHEGSVISYTQEYKRVKRVELELVSLDSREGSEIARLYGITQYPAVLALAENGSLQKFWQGEMLPTMNELEYYTLEAMKYSLNPHSTRP